MGNQEQQFYSPEQYPSTPQQSYQYQQTASNVNVDPREGQQQEMYGGPEYYTGRGEKLQPRSASRKKFRALWLLPMAILFIAGMSYGLFGSHEHSSKSFGYARPEQVFKVANPNLIINDTAGNIRIHSDEDSSNAGTVTVHIDTSSNSQSAPIVKFDPTSGTITVTANSQGFADSNVDIDIRTPKTSNVQLIDRNGNIDIEGVSGTVSAQTTKGKIDTHDVSGQVTLASTDGDVSLENGSLSGQSSLHSDNGDIHYDGSIDPRGSYKFDTVNGSVDVQLPDNSAFRLVENSTHGRFENEFGSNDVGSGTQAQLTISSTNGSIRVSKNG